MRFSFIAPLILSLAACAAPEPTQVAAASPADGSARRVECHQESDMGSNMIHKVCRPVLTDAEEAALHEQVSDKLHEMQRTTLPKGN